MKTAIEAVEKNIASARAKARMPVGKMFILAIFAGIYIAFGAFGSQVAAAGNPVASVGKYMGAFVFPIGLMMVILTGAELFTGNCLMLTGVMDRKVAWGKMLKNWLTVYIGNFVGSVFIAAMLVYGHSMSAFDGALARSVVSTAASKVSLSFSDAFIRGILCNMLVCIAVWISYAVEEAAGKIIGIFLPIALFVLSGYEHCVANMYFIPAGLMAKAEYGIDAPDLTVGSFLINNLLPVTLGNIVGGAIIIAGGYFLAHKTFSRASKD
ncbi:MAG: formate/nitrite transporter family protein [Lachnospiraceae bacterium]|jgi:formate/nitrite transporter|nr:formate/nitrite transporter family protein [Lachnospiraceae bacterium]